jgi:hypothetical protein
MAVRGVHAILGLRLAVLLHLLVVPGMRESAREMEREADERERWLL